MKKSKILLVTVLALVLCLLCVTTSTFSWLPRPKTLKGDSLAWDIQYDSSVGKDISMVTYVSSDDGETFDESNPIKSFTNTVGIDAGERICYRTDISNKGAATQSVSLYFSSLDLTGSSGKFCVGVNSPLKTYKNYTKSSGGAETAVAKKVNSKNVYVGFNVNQTYDPTYYKVHWWNSESGAGDSSVKSYFNPNQQGDYASSKYNMSYTTIPYDAGSVRPWDNVGTWYGSDNNDVNTNNTIIFYSDKGNTNVDYKQSGIAAGLDSFYSSASVDVGSTLSLAATGQGNIKYASSDETIAKVDANTGVVTGVKAGTATITVTSKGAYGDIISSSCVLTVLGVRTDTISDVPIVTNVKVVAGVGTDTGVTTESIYWYIKNDGTGTLKYTVEDLYLTL